MSEDEQSQVTGPTDDAGAAGESAHPAASAPSSHPQASAESGSSGNTAASPVSAGVETVTAASAGERDASPASAGIGAADSARPWYARPPARALMIAVTLAGLAYALMFFRGLQDIVAPVFLALNFYIVVYPVQRALTRLKVPRAIGACLSVVLVLCMIIAFFGLTAWSVAELVILIPSYSNELVETYQSALAMLSDIGVTSSVIQEQLKGFDVRSVLDAVYPLLSNASSVAGLLTTVVMAVFFIAMDSMGIDKRMRMLLDVKPSLSAPLSDFAGVVRRYWVVATIFGLIVAFLDVIALAIIDEIGRAHV